MLLVSSLTRPVSLPSKMEDENICTVHELTAAARRNTSLREGGGLGRSPKTEGASGRIVNSQDRGGTSPGGVRVPVPTRRKAPVKSVWGIDTTSKYQPIRKPPAYPPLAPSVTCGDSSLPEGAAACRRCHFRTVIFSKSLLPLQCPVSAACGRVP